MPNLSALAPLTTAATALSNLVLVTPQSVQGYQAQNKDNADGTPSTAQQPPAFLFHYEGEQSVTLESDITDHYVEDNSAVQDQIALRPEVVNTSGFIGELNNVVPSALKPVKFIADKLTAIGSYAPSLSTTALLAYSEAFFLYQVASNVVDSAVSAWSSINSLAPSGTGEVSVGSGVFKSTGVQNKQQVAFQQWYGYWRDRRLFTVQTPWAVFQNMAIKSITPVQSEETNVITEFKISFKKIRTALTFSIDSRSELSGRAATQASGLTDLGTSTPVSSDSLGTGLTNMGAP